MRQSQKRILFLYLIREKRERPRLAPAGFNRVRAESDAAPLPPSYGGGIYIASGATVYIDTFQVDTKEATVVTNDRQLGQPPALNTSNFALPFSLNALNWLMAGVPSPSGSSTSA
jgi:hypothetical protein